MINKKRLGIALEKYLVDEVGYDPSDAFKKITMKRKKKMILEQTTNGIKARRKNVIKIEIIE